MTLLMVWREQTLDRLWIVSDSRLSRSGEGGGVVRLTDRGAIVTRPEDLAMVCANCHRALHRTPEWLNDLDAMRAAILARRAG
jgi:hypothetical protein